MSTLADMIAMRDALEAARFSGQRLVQVGSFRTEFKTDSEMKAALADLNRKIASASGSTGSPFVTFTTSKGL